MNWARVIPLALAVIAAGPAPAQTPPTLGDSAKALIGAWEFSNAGRDKVCTVTFEGKSAPGGFRLDFDADCRDLFPLLNNIVSWEFPDNDLLRLLDAQGKALVEFSEVESGTYEAPTPGAGVLFLQKAEAAGPPPKPPEQVAGDWAITRGGAPVCTLNLSTDAVKDSFVLIVMPGCDAAIAKMNFTQWRLDRGELVLTPAHGNSWRFEEGEGGIWSRLPESPDRITLVRQ